MPLSSVISLIECHFVRRRDGDRPRQNAAGTTMAEKYQQHILICESIKIMESVVQFHHGFAFISNSMDNKVEKIK